MQDVGAAKVAKFEIFDYILGRCIQGAWAPHALKAGAILLFSMILLERYAASY
jgi:predicted membrane-bound mannosyltransferase